MRIDFAFGAAQRLRAACDAVHKRVSAGGRVVVYCGERQRLAEFDRALWAFADTSFVPHVAADSPLASSTPVVLTASDPAAAVPDDAQPQTWLLNLDDACPPNYDRYARLLELVSDDEADAAPARQRWRDYKAAGHELRSHNLRK